MPIWIYPDLNDTDPAAPDGSRNAKWQADPNTYLDDNGIRRRHTSTYVPNAWGTIAVKSGSYAPVQADSGKILPCDGTFTVTLPASGSPVLPAMFGSPEAQDADWEIYVQNNGSGTITVDGGGCQIDGSASSITLSQNQGILLRVTEDGSGWQTFRGASSGSGTGDVVGPSSSTDGDFAQFDGTTGKLMKDGGLSLDTDGTLAANSDSKIPSQKAVKTYVDAKNGAAYCTVDGGGSLPTTGFKAYLRVPYACTIKDFMLLANASGICQFDVKKSSYSGFPTTTSIVASAPPTLSSAQKNQSTTLTGWTTSISADDILEFDLSSVSGSITWLQLSLKLQRA